MKYRKVPRERVIVSSFVPKGEKKCHIPWDMPGVDGNSSIEPNLILTKYFFNAK